MKTRIEAGTDGDIPTDSCALDIDAKSDGKNSHFMIIAENHTALCDGAAFSEVLCERNGNGVEDQRLYVAAPLPAAHQIATRSATGRLAKRPRKDLSPARSPPRKIGIYVVFLFSHILIS